ncbi:MAG: zinc ribbon domain-containing protein [Clostridia bacterium]|nr:zinc ribbon domain-containing protein [Clostridia bacterium]
MNCPNCGRVLNNDVLFCGFCGHRMGDPVARNTGTDAGVSLEKAGGYTPPAYVPPAAPAVSPYTAPAPVEEAPIPGYSAPDLTPEAPSPNKGKAIAAMILGLSSLLFVTLCLIWTLSIIFAPIALGCGIAAVVLGNKARVPGVSKANGMAKTGKVTGLVGLIISAILLGIVITVLIIAGGLGVFTIR